jgi:thiol-disulfide isomerase/thioredoxin
MRYRAASALVALFLLLGPLHAQPTMAALAGNEQQELTKAIEEAGPSQVDFIHALERHLKKYPQTTQRPAIEKALSKSAVETNDHARIIQYGVQVLDSDQNSEDLPLLDRVTRELLDDSNPSSPGRALIFAQRYRKTVESMRSRAAEGHMSPGQWALEVNKGAARAMVLQGRAMGNLGAPEEAVKLAKSAWTIAPGSEPAQELARWLEKTGKTAEAFDAYADAFTCEDARGTEADRAAARAKLGELWTKLHGTDPGLGEAILQAYDRNAELKRTRMRSMKGKDPNVYATTVSEYILPRADATGSLALTSLKGKAVVMDFWATWCTPCRVQHPLIENVKKKYAQDANVVFLSIDADDDHSVVPGFLKEMKWEGASYYDAGLGHLLNITSIPTLLVLDTTGRISSRMTGFIPDRFEDMLAERIETARGN